jgi:aminopeptidase N
LGEERFDYAFKTYIKRWAYKHPSPWDFFNTMENVSGENLNWFWKGWFTHGLVLDQSIDSVEFIPNKGSKITISNNLTMAMPVFLDYTTSSGKKGSVKLPVEIWNNTANFQFMIEETDSLLQVNIDPNGYFPDVERLNNVWGRKEN